MVSRSNHARVRWHNLTMNRDCYSILGVPRSATIGEIRAAYRRLAHQYHPDVNSGPEAEARMQEINEAYATLSDPARRRLYDQIGATSNRSVTRRGSPTGPRRGTAPSRDYIPQRGGDIETAVIISEREGRAGTRKTFLVERLETCPRCRGSGIEPEEIAIAGRCWRCAGEQRLPRTLRLNAIIPPGVTDGERFRLRGQGNAGTDNGVSGHVYITARFAPNRGLKHALTFTLRHLFG